jgi:hypothetical protein
MPKNKQENANNSGSSAESDDNGDIWFDKVWIY